MKEFHGLADVMIRLLFQMLRMPVVLVVTSFEAISKAFQELQQSFDQGVGAMLFGGAASAGSRSGSTSDPSVALTNEDSSSAHAIVQESSQPHNRKETAMPSQWLGSCDSTDPAIADLSGNDIKTVRWRIIFTKPDLVHSFEDRTDVVDYSTNGTSLAGIHVSEFNADVAARRYERPRKWRENNYPTGIDFPGGLQTPPDDWNWRFPVEDRRYIEFQYEVLRREPKQDPYYDRDRNRDLRQINQSVQQLQPAGRIGLPAPRPGAYPGPGWLWDGVNRNWVWRTVPVGGFPRLSGALPWPGRGWLWDPAPPGTWVFA
jgi:hypothetical protein